MKNIMDDLEKRILSEQKFIFLRKSDGALILTSRPYWLRYTKTKKRVEIDWYQEDKPFYSHYARWGVFFKRHDYVGEL